MKPVFDADKINAQIQNIQTIKDKAYNEAIQDAIAECYKVRPEVMFGVSDSDPSLIQHKKVNEIISKLQQLKK